MDSIFIYIIIFLSFLSILVGFWQFFLYARLSWLKRDNSKGFNGIETAKAVLDKQNRKDIDVKTSFWSLTYVRYSSSNKTLKLGKIDSVRRSIWTVATSGRQAFSAFLLQEAKEGKKPPISSFWIRIQTFWFSLFMSFIFNIGFIVTGSLWIAGIVEDGKVMGLWFWLFLSLIVMFPLLVSIASFKTSKLMMKEANNIFGGIFEEDEINKIKTLWKVEFINSVIELIKTSVILIFFVIKMILLAKSSK